MGILHKQACKSIGTSLRSQWQLITEIKNTQNLDYGNGNAPIIQGKKGKSNNVIITHNLCTYLSKSMQFNSNTPQLAHSHQNELLVIVRRKNHT